MKALILGYGHAGRAYGLAISHLYECCDVDVFDKNPNVVIAPPFKRVESLEGEYDLIVVATPPDSHFEAARAVLSLNAVTIIEKPFALNEAESRALLDLSCSHSLYFSIHSMFGDELNLHESWDDSFLGERLSVTHLFCDPYGSGNRSLGGPFWDSIYNVIGVFLKLVKLDHKLEQIEIVTDSPQAFDTRLVYRSLTTSKVIEQTIVIRWDIPINYKVTQISSADKSLTYSHSQQVVTDDLALTTRVSKFHLPRLSAHYAKAVQEAMQGENIREKNLAIAERINDLVWSINAKRR